MKKPDKQQMSELLKTPNVQIDRSKNPLARIYRSILHEIGMNPVRWNKLMERYLHDPRNGISDDNTKRHQARNNLNRQLASPQMSFKTILRGIRILFPLQVDMTMKIHWYRDIRTEHNTTIFKRSEDANINGFEPKEDLDDLYVDDEDSSKENLDD